MPRFMFALLVVVGIAVPLHAQSAQTPGPQNLQVLPKDIPRERLIQRMREFSIALGVRCQYCHAGGNGVSLEGVSFPSDEKPAKNTARVMMRMVDQLNTSVLAQIPHRAEPRVVVDCATCHRGTTLPKSLQTTLFEIITEKGVAAAVARYRELREDALLGRYNFGELEVNDLARRLGEAGKGDAAIAILELNGEFYPKSADIDALIGEEYRRQGNRDKAIERYRAALIKMPEHGVAKQRLQELERKP